MGYGYDSTFFCGFVRRLDVVDEGIYISGGSGFSVYGEGELGAVGRIFEF